MGPRGHRRQVLLFLAAILVPCLVLLALSVRMIGQERALAEKRREDNRLRFRDQVRRDLLARLERMKTGDPARHPEVVLAARFEDQRLVLPWESEQPAARFREMLGRGAFASRIHEAERHDLTRGEAPQAVRGYDAALRLATGPAQAAYARLLYAGSLEKVGRARDAAGHFRLLLTAPAGWADDQGVPFRLSAAEALFREGLAEPAVVATVAWAAAQRPPLAPAAHYILSALAEKLAPAPLRAQIAARTREMDQALALQRDLPGLDLPASGPPLWLLYGAEPWLVSRGGEAVIAVRAAAVLGQVESAWNRSGAGVRFATALGEKGEPLGNDLPGLRAAVWLAPDSADTRLQWRFMYAVVLLMLGATMFGASLLWRDLRRDMRLAELRSQFVSSVSHELKTPLTAIRMFAETLEMGRSQDPQVQREYLETIVNECERLSRLVDDVLLFSKIEQDKKAYRFRRLNLAEVVESVARTMQYPLEQQGFALRVEADEDLAPASADPDALAQALLNLLSNAMKYSGDARQIELELRADPEGAVIRVTDHGLGIAPEEQGRIFGKYYRAPTRENQLIPGTGLGLTLVAHIVKAHGGRIELRSAPGQGSTFSIFLPLEENHEHGPGSRR